MDTSEGQHVEQHKPDSDKMHMVFLLCGSLKYKTNKTKNRHPYVVPACSMVLY